MDLRKSLAVLLVKIVLQEILISGKSKRVERPKFWNPRNYQRSKQALHERVTGELLPGTHLSHRTVTQLREDDGWLCTVN